MIALCIRNSRGLAVLTLFVLAQHLGCDAQKTTAKPAKVDPQPVESPTPEVPDPPPLGPVATTSPTTPSSPDPAGLVPPLYPKGLEELKNWCLAQHLEWSNEECLCPITTRRFGSTSFDVRQELVLHNGEPYCRNQKLLQPTNLIEHGCKSFTEALTKNCPINFVPAQLQGYIPKYKTDSPTSTGLFIDWVDGEVKSAAWIDENLLITNPETGELYYKPFFFRQGHYPTNYHPTKISRMDRWDLKWYLMYPSFADPIFRYNRPESILSVDVLPTATWEITARWLGLTSRATEPVVPPPAELVLDDADLQLLARAVTEQPKYEKRFEEVIYRNCFHLCKQIRQQQFDGFSANRTTLYKSGVKTRQIVFVYRNHEVIGAVSLDGEGSPLLCIRIFTHWNGRHLVSNLRVYTDRWNLAYSDDENVDENLLDKAIIQRAQDSIQQAAPLLDGEVSVVDCIGDGYNFPAEQVQALLRGPYAISPDDHFVRDNKGSLFGWTKPESLSIPHYFSGVFFADPWTNLHFCDQDFGHSALVERVLLDPTFDPEPAIISFMPSLRLIPLNRLHCLEEGGMSIPKEFGRARVANISNLEYLEAASCAHLRKLDSKVLYVAGAGNEGQTLGAGGPSPRCPQNLGPLHNLITVTGVDDSGDQIHPHADQGADYADIGARYRLPDHSEAGTSIAAPQVAHVAARIYQMHRETFERDEEQGVSSVALVRLAILASARVPAIPLATRTGGSLDVQSAYRVAGRIFQTLTLEQRRLFASPYSPETKEELRTLLQNLLQEVLQLPAQAVQTQVQRLFEGRILLPAQG